MTVDYDSAIDSTTTRRPAVEGEGPGGWRDRLRRDVAPLGFDAATNRLSPSATDSVSTNAAPGVTDTATTSLEGIVGSEHENESLCYMENAHKMRVVLEAHKAALEKNDALTNRAEIERVTRMIGFLSWAQAFVSGGKTRKADMDKAAQAAFPDLEGAEAGKAAKALYFIASTIPSTIGKAPTPLRGGGIGGALAAMGGAEMLYQDEMIGGGLQPGAPLQMWWGGSYRLRGKDEYIDMTGKQVYQNITRARMHPDDGISGHSVTFVKYDADNPKKIWYLQQWDNALDSHVLGSDSGTYFVGANLSTTGDALKTAESVLKDTGFKADYGRDQLVRRAKAYNLDAGKLAAALKAGITGSGHADLQTLQAAADRLSPTDFDHDMARLVGLWQSAVGATCDGDFGNGSCTTLTGQRLDAAVSIKKDAVRE